jgi:hypothetical protein
VIDCGLEFWSDQTKDYTIVICVYDVAHWNISLQIVIIFNLLKEISIW